MVSLKCVWQKFRSSLGNFDRGVIATLNGDMIKKSLVRYGFEILQMIVSEQRVASFLRFLSTQTPVLDKMLVVQRLYAREESKISSKVKLLFVCLINVLRLCVLGYLLVFCVLGLVYSMYRKSKSFMSHKFHEQNNGMSFLASCHPNLAA